MRMRLGFIAGLATGYVLGAKAGTERFEEIKQMASKVRGTEPVQQIEDELRVVTEKATDKATEKIEKVGEKIGASETSINGTSTGTAMTEGGTTPPA